MGLLLHQVLSQPVGGPKDATYLDRYSNDHHPESGR